MAITFETDRAPYVIKNSLDGFVQFEVPWRDGTAIRSANRTELLKILVPLQRLPSIEVLSGFLTARHISENNIWHWHFELQLYVASTLQTRVVIPFHKCSGTLELSQYFAPTPLTSLALRPLKLGHGQVFSSDTPPIRPQPESLTIDGTSSELIVQGPGKFQLIAEMTTESLHGDLANTIATVRASLRPVDSESAIPIKADMAWAAGKELGHQHEKGRWSANSK